MDSRFISEPSAIVSGSTAWLLSKVLHSPNVRKVLANAPAIVNRADLNATVVAIDLAARAWESGLTLQQRDNAAAPGAVVPHCWSTKRAAEHLRMSQRRVQELASNELGGRRVGREWRLPEMAVRAYEQRKAGRAA